MCYTIPWIVLAACAFGFLIIGIISFSWAWKADRALKRNRDDWKKRNMGGNDV